MKKINKNSSSKSKFIKKRGFTLIELIVVMAVIAILVLLAMPKFMNYAEEARVTRIKNDVKVAEDMATEYLVEYDKFPGDWDSVSVSELETIKDENRLYEKEGLATSIQSGEYVAIDKDFVKTKVRSKLKGTFYANLDAKVYYEDSKAGKPSNDGGNDNGDEDENEGNVCPTTGMVPIDFPDGDEIFFSLLNGFTATINESRDYAMGDLIGTVESSYDSEYSIINCTYLKDTNTGIEYIITMVELFENNVDDVKYIIALDRKYNEESSEYEEYHNKYYFDESFNILRSYDDIYELCPTHIGNYDDNDKLISCTFIWTRGSNCPISGIIPTDFPGFEDMFYVTLSEEYTVEDMIYNMIETLNECAEEDYELYSDEYSISNITYLTDTNTDEEYILSILELYYNFSDDAKYIMLVKNKFNEANGLNDYYGLCILDEDFNRIDSEVLDWDRDEMLLLLTHIGLYDNNGMLLQCEQIDIEDPDLSNWVFIDIEENMSGGQLLTAKNDNNEYKYVLVNNPVEIAYKDNFKRIKADKLKDEYLISEEENSYDPYINPEVYTTFNQKPDYIYDACNYIINGELYSYKEKFTNNNNPYKSILFVSDDYCYFASNPELNYNYDIYVQKENGDIELIKVIYDSDDKLYTTIRKRPELTNLLGGIEIKQSFKIDFHKTVMIDQNNDLYHLLIEDDLLYVLEYVDLESVDLDNIMLNESEYILNEIEKGSIQLQSGINKSFIPDESESIEYPDIVYYIKDINEMLYKIDIETYTLIEDENLVDFNEWILSERDSLLEYYVLDFMRFDVEINEQIIDNAKKILFSMHDIGKEYKAVYILTNEGKLYVIGEIVPL